MVGKGFLVAAIMTNQGVLVLMISKAYGAINTFGNPAAVFAAHHG